MRPSSLERRLALPHRVALAFRYLHQAHGIMPSVEDIARHLPADPHDVAWASMVRVRLRAGW